MVRIRNFEDLLSQLLLVAKKRNRYNCKTICPYRYHIIEKSGPPVDKPVKAPLSSSLPLPLLQHRLQKDPVPFRGILHEHVGHGAHQFAILDDGRAGHECVHRRTKILQTISICNRFLSTSLLFSVFRPLPFPSESSGHGNPSHSIDFELLCLLLLPFLLYIE